MKKGFTLIELLAVIVILAIIAIIAIPIILGIIKDAKDNANKKSVENYADTIKNALVRYQLKENKQTTSFEDIKEYIEYDGNVVCDIIQIYEDGNIYLNGCIINNDNSRGYFYGEQHLASENVRASTESKTGIVPIMDSSGNIVPGSEFKIKVSNNIKDENGNIAEYKFFVLSNSEDGKYVNLIAEQNITIDGMFTSKLQNGDEWYVTESNSSDIRYGPQTAYNYLSIATNNWINVPIIKSFIYGNEEGQLYPETGYQSIKIEPDVQTGKYITTIKPYSSDYGEPKIYENMRARLPYLDEVIKNTTCNFVRGQCPLWMVNYLYSSSYYSTEEEKINSEEQNNRYWLLSSERKYYSSYNTYAYGVSNDGYLEVAYSSHGYTGIRPVITILKSDLLKVM